ncbi:MAG TPA: hypothetical protein VGO15_05625 [Candidatus Limnocylindrales bacterium]|nr:hypothetical protein [Candidatus Limnocylindrales bacterium]
MIETNATPSRRVTFAATPADPASAPGDGSLTVVLDASWTPEPGGRPDVVSIRPSFATVLERHDLYDESLVLLDRWADEAGLADLLVVEGVTYWYRLREPLWHWVHERLLWRYTLAAIDAEGARDHATVPWSEAALIDVLRASGWTIDVEGSPPARQLAIPRRERRSSSRWMPSAVRRLVRRVVPRPEPAAAAARRHRQAVLDQRFERLSRLAGPRVLVLTLPGSYQRIGAGTGPASRAARRDPNLGSVIPALRGAGLEPIVIGWGMGRGREEADWPVVEADDRLLPAWYVAAHGARPGDDLRASEAIEGVLTRLDALSAIPFDLDGLDLASPLVETLQSVFQRTIDADVHELARVERLIEELRPGAILTTQEAHRTPWLLAGARAGVPTFALQHGVLYPRHPGYADRRHPMLLLPSRTFVFGPYERRVLEGLAYRSDELAVSGSPRLDLDAGGAVASSVDGERSAVRAELGVAGDDLLLVVSTVHVPFVQRSHLLHMLDVLLGGPLPGVHVVFKQHPGEEDAGPYRSLLEGIARAGGYDAPPMTVVKDIDLYRLLRAADAHLGQLSTVLTDAVVTGTPNLIAAVGPGGDILGYVAAGVARPVGDIAELRQALRDPRPPEPSSRQAFLDDHFRAGDASSRIAVAIQTAVREPSRPAAAGPL